MNNTTTTRLELNSILLLSSTEGAVAASRIIRCVKRTPAYPAAARHVHLEEVVDFRYARVSELLEDSHSAKAVWWLIIFAIGQRISFQGLGQELWTSL